MSIPQSMRTPDQDAPRLVEPTDRRPEFCAEALSPRFRLGLLLLTWVSVTTLVVGAASMALLPQAALVGSTFAGVMYVALSLAVTFMVFLVFGALVANNPRLHAAGRIGWYASFVVAGPLALPLYWLMHVHGVPYEPLASPEGAG